MPTPMYMQLECTNLRVQTPEVGPSQACEALSLVLLADSRFQALTIALHLTEGHRSPGVSKR